MAYEEEGGRREEEIVVKLGGRGRCGTVWEKSDYIVYIYESLKNIYKQNKIWRNIPVR